MPYSEFSGDFTQFDARPLSPAIGAELIGADLAAPSDTLVEEVRAALLQYQVVFFRDQDITRSQHIAFASAFGELDIHPATPKDQPDREVLRIVHGPNSRGMENAWHSDVTWREQPSLGSILRAIELPEVGGDTLFSNMVMAYEDLDEDLKTRLCGMTAVHDIARVFAKRLGKDAAALHEKFPLMEHFTDHIKGLDRDESDTLLKFLYSRAAIPEYQCRFRWALGSIAFWDNRACQHYAASDYFPNTRIMERVTIAGDRPYFDTNA